MWPRWEKEKMVNRNSLKEIEKGKKEQSRSRAIRITESLLQLTAIDPTSCLQKQSIRKVSALLV